MVVFAVLGDELLLGVNLGLDLDGLLDLTNSYHGLLLHRLERLWWALACRLRH